MVRFYGNGFLGGYEKLRTIKTARFCGRVLFGCESIRFTFKKLLNDKI